MIAFHAGCYDFSTHVMSGEQRLLLVVEDDVEVRETLDDFLTDEGFRIVTARNGKDALAQLRAGLRPAAILLDLLMPEMDGWQFRQEQIADEALNSIATLIFTATSPPETAARMPGVEVIRKPIDADELVHTVRRLCGLTLVGR